MKRNYRESWRKFSHPFEIWQEARLSLCARVWWNLLKYRDSQEWKRAKHSSWELYIRINTAQRHEEKINRARAYKRTLRRADDVQSFYPRDLPVELNKSPPKSDCASKKEGIHRPSFAFVVPYVSPRRARARAGANISSGEARIVTAISFPDYTYPSKIQSFRASSRWNTGIFKAIKFCGSFVRYRLTIRFLPSECKAKKTKQAILLFRNMHRFNSCTAFYAKIYQFLQCTKVEKISICVILIGLRPRK